MAAGSRPTTKAPGSRGGARPRRSVAKRVALVLGGLVVVGGALGVAAFAYGYASTDVPEPTELGQKATTTVFYADGTTQLGQFADVNRTPVETADVPEVMRQAVIAAEDRSFYENRGVSPSSIARAFVSNLRGNATQGGSTITQQYVKNYYTGDDTQSLERKVREAFIALKVDQQLDKDEILTDYLNTIYFGRGAYGVQEAAQAYFGVDVGQLDASQAALLAGVVPAPSAYDPAVDPAAAEGRWEYVVDGMVETGALTQAERDALVLPATAQQETDEVYAGPDGYLLQAVRDELTTRGAFTADELDGGGLTITTTFDVGMQEDAVAAMEDEDAFPVEDRPEDVVGALVSIDPADGAVKAMYGGSRSSGGLQRYGGAMPGSEAVWDPLFADNGGYGPFIGHYVYSLNSPPFDWRRDLNWDDQYDVIKAALTPVTAAPSPDLTAFRARGGKLVQFHGWNDPVVTPQGSIAYYNALIQFEKFKALPRERYDAAVAALTGAQVTADSLALAPTIQDFHRLFMAPEVGHCGGGTGPSAIGGGFTEPAKAQRVPESHVVSALARWVEQGVAPDAIVATRYAADGTSITRQRPVCAYPRAAVYRGGDVNAAASFQCVAADAERLPTDATDLLLIRNAMRQRDVLTPVR